MFLHKIKSDVLAHLSYMIGSNGSAAVIDPRRDIDIYMEIARNEGCRITHLFETHRNEDLISGTPALKEATGAKVLHGPNPEQPVVYAETTHEGDEYNIGSACISVLETPGHTFDSVSYVLYDTENGEEPVGVFTGDALFIGDVGRTDFYPDRKREVAGLLFDSLQKLIALGDQTIVYPAHGAGSVCGSGMADREFSTIGHERANNEPLRIKDRDAFIDTKVAEHHYIPPYFSRMEKLNMEGGPAMARYKAPPPVTPKDPRFDDGETQVIDIRSETDFAAAHVAGSYCIPKGMLAAFAGWFLDPEKEILLLSDSSEQAEAAAVTLARIGFDRVTGYHAGTVPFAVNNRPLESLDLIDTETVKARLSQSAPDWSLLDVRGIDEYEAGHIEGAQHAYVGKLPDALSEVNLADHVTVMCGTGMRATIAASVLQRAGYPVVDVYYGSWKAWKAGQ